MTDTTVLDIAGRDTVLQPVVPDEPINVRVATQDDYEFIDALQKKHSKMVGFLHRASIEAYIRQGGVLIAESAPRHSCEGRNPQTTDIASSAVDARFRGHDGDLARLGYCISKDTYYKREDTGVIYQMNIVPEVQRGLIAATLLKETFARSPYGVKLYCCWCAQDLGANHFWEAMGFTPLAFRTGSPKRGKKSTPRMHVFWQKRIRAGDEGPGATPWWFPSETKGGAIGCGRIVIPIPIGAHWSDPMPVILPGEPERLQIDGDVAEDEETPANRKRTRRKKADPQPAAKPKVKSGGLCFSQPEPEKPNRKPRPKRTKQKNNPKYVAAARELRDRFLEEIERQPELLEGQSTGGKYDVSRQIEAAPSAMSQSQVQLPTLDAA